ncbi:MAG: hypothetical protein M3Y87_00435, partial [Myxococcota bacterium]|nr:hypothetical protein [Myxococcota bacterium]
MTGPYADPLDPAGLGHVGQALPESPLHAIRKVADCLDLGGGAAIGDDPGSLTAGTKSSGPIKDRPTLLMVGHGEPMDAALRAALDRHGLFVEEASTDDASAAVRMAAPDLVLLVGDAAKDGGRAVLEALATDPATNVVPVALLAEDEGALDKRVLAFRYGAIATVPRSASADEIARRVAQLAHELPDRSDAGSAELGEATFDELVSLVTRELRSGILSVGRQGGAPSRIVLGAGRPVAEAVQEFVEKMRPLVSRAEPLVYEFHKDGAGGAIGLLDAEGARSADLTIFEGLRVLLVDHDPSRADALAQELRGRGATVAVSDSTGRGLERAGGLDPQVVVMDAAGIEGAGFEVVRQLRRDVRLRWASILVAPWDELWPNPRGAPDAERLAEKIAPLVLHDRALRARALEESAFDARLEATGPCRLLRVLAALPGPYHVTVRSSKAVVEIDLAEGLVVGASGSRASSETLEGTRALAALLAMGSARVHVERRANPSTANVMSPLDEALAHASQETPPIPPSMLPPSFGGGDLPASTSGRRRPFPNASELGRDPSLLTGMGMESEHDLSGPIVAPPTATRLSPSVKPAVAEDLSWGAAAGARKVPPVGPRVPGKSPVVPPPKATAGLVTPRAPERAEVEPFKLPHGVLSGRPSIVPRPGDAPRGGARQQTIAMGVLRGTGKSVQGMQAVRSPAVPPPPDVSGRPALELDLDDEGPSAERVVPPIAAPVAPPEAAIVPPASPPVVA